MAGGFFTSIGGQPRNYIARLDPVTGLADSFNPNASGYVWSIAVQADSKILVGVISTASAGRQVTLAVQTDGKILAGGYFSNIGGQPRHSIARLAYVSGPPPAAQALNLSSRIKVQTGDNIGIGGFIITGTAPKHVILRVLGPARGPFPPDPTALPDPTLELHGPGAFATITNDNWRDDPPAGSRDPGRWPRAKPIWNQRLIQR